MNDIDWYKMTERPEERALRRKLRRAAIWDVIGGILLAILGIVLFWLYLAATPPQSSAINDREADDGIAAEARQWRHTGEKIEARQALPSGQEAEP